MLNDSIYHTHDEKQRGVPYYKSPKIKLGKVSMNFCLVAEPNRPSGIHREHDRPIRELHVQVAGEGAVDLLRSADPGDVFASLPLIMPSETVRVHGVTGSL